MCKLERRKVKQTGFWMMNPAVWKVLSGLLLACVLVQHFETLGRNQLFRSEVKETPLDPSSSRTLDWKYDWKRDGNNHGLNIEQCNSAFPELYSEIKRATEFWKDGSIEAEEIDLFASKNGGLRVLIHDQQVRVIETRGLYRDDFRYRISAVLQQLSRAITAAEWANEPFSDMEFTIVVDDFVTLPREPRALWAFARAHANLAHDSLFLIPDFHFYAAPPEAEGFQAMQARARKHDSEIEAKIPKVVWRGVEWTNKEIRAPLLNVTHDQPWADVVPMNWNDQRSVIPMDDFCRYRFAVNTEGRAWSARLTHLLNCDNLVLVHDVEWIAHYYHLLDTEVDNSINANCVHVKRDFSDLEAKVKYYNNHTDQAQEIATRAREMFRERYTSPAATACYWRHLMRAWSTVAFNPVIMERVEGGGERMRGISIEEFNLHTNNVDFPYRK